MRVLILSMLLLAGCSKNFDAQYAETEEKVKAAEAKLDAQMAKEAAKEPGEAAKTEISR